MFRSTPFSIRSDVAVEGRLRDVEPLADLPRRDVLVLHQRLHLRDVVLAQGAGTPTGSSSLPRRPQAGHRALPAELPLKLRQRAEDVEGEPPLRGCRVDPFGEAHEVDAPLL